MKSMNREYCNTDTDTEEWRPRQVNVVRLEKGQPPRIIRLKPTAEAILKALGADELKMGVVEEHLLFFCKEDGNPIVNFINENKEVKGPIIVAFFTNQYKDIQPWAIQQAQAKINLRT